MITLIPDTNALRHPALEAYLKASLNHSIAFCDLTLIEMRKTNALSTSRESLQIASRYPRQVFVLRRTDQILRENIISGASTGALFDYSSGVELSELCQQLQTIPISKQLVASMAQAEQDARVVIMRLSEEVAALEPGLVDAAHDFTPSELRQIRTTTGLTDQTRRKLLELLKQTTRDFIIRNQQPGRRAPMLLREAMGTFAFRYSLCMLLYYIEWVRDGRTTGKKLARRVNDVIDMQVAAMGTFFNGILSADADLQTISNAARDVLRRFGAYVGDDWRPSLPPDGN